MEATWEAGGVQHADTSSERDVSELMLEDDGDEGPEVDGELDEEVRAGSPARGGAARRRELSLFFSSSRHTS